MTLRSKLLDTKFDNVALFEPHLGSHAYAHARRRARGDDVARKQYHELADITDERGAIEDHSTRVTGLPTPPVDVDPSKMDSLSNVAEFRQRTRIPVTASETIATRWGFKDLLELRACDFVMPDLGWVGGLSEARKIGNMAEAYGLPVAPHDCTGPVVLRASTHLSLSAANAVIQESVRALYTGWYTEVATQLPIVRNGMITVPEGPGLGMKLQPGIEKRADAIHRVSKA